MLQMNPESIAFALITYYPKWYQGKLRSIKHTDKIRGDLALEFIHKAVEKGHQVVVVDGKSSKTFFKNVQQIPQIHIRKSHTPRRAPKRRLAFQVASKLPQVKIIVSTEAEKVSLLTDCLPQIVQPIFEGKADIVVPKREDSLFKKTYPLYMYESEVEGNILYNHNLRVYKLLTTGEDLDMFFGPKVFLNSPKILALFMKRNTFSLKNFTLPPGYFDMEEYGNTMYFPTVEALLLKLRVMSKTVPFSYPLLQKKNEEEGEKKLFVEKRKLQKLSILFDLMFFLRFKHATIES